MTAFAVWLGVVVNRARGQRKAVEAIEAVAVLAVRLDLDRFAEASFREGLLGPRAEVLAKVRRVDPIQANLVLRAVDKQS